MKRRTIDVHDYNAGNYFKRLEGFLGTNEIEWRLSSIDLELRTETGVYLQYWVLPKQAWWLGFRAARELIHRGESLRHAVTPIMERPLQTAVKLSMLYSSTPDWKRQEFRSRILADDILDPTIFEIDCAAHFYMSGYDISWFEISNKERVRTPEFVAKLDQFEIEVECKAKKADSGRRIERATFYRVVDHLVPVIQEKGLCGSVFLTVPTRLPTSTSWRTEAAKSLDEQLKPGDTTITLPGGEQFRCELTPMNGSEILIEDFKKRVAATATPYSHYALFSNRSGNFLLDPIIFRLERA